MAAARVGVYVDGYNLYYGSLHGNSYKWLDLVKLIELALQRDQNERLECVHLSTAWALANFDAHRNENALGAGPHPFDPSVAYPGQAFGRHRRTPHSGER